jgi:hypothetical protein
MISSHVTSRSSRKLLDIISYPHYDYLYRYRCSSLFQINERPAGFHSRTPLVVSRLLIFSLQHSFQRILNFISLQHCTEPSYRTRQLHPSSFQKGSSPITSHLWPQLLFYRINLFLVQLGSPWMCHYLCPGHHWRELLGLQTRQFAT